MLRLVQSNLRRLRQRDEMWSDQSWRWSPNPGAAAAISKCGCAVTRAARSPPSYGWSASSTIPMWRVPDGRGCAPARPSSLRKSTTSFACSSLAPRWWTSAPPRAAGARSRRNGSVLQEAKPPHKPAPRNGRVVAIDILDMPAIPGVDFLRLDFLDPAAPDRLKALLGGLADVVLSDMAANATGHRKTDHLRIMALAEAAAMFARDVLR